MATLSRKKSSARVTRNAGIEHTVLSISETRTQLSETINRVHYAGEVVVLHRRGQDLAAIVPIDEYNRLRVLSGEDALKVKQARKARSETRVPWKDAVTNARAG